MNEFGFDDDEMGRDRANSWDARYDDGDGVRWNRRWLFSGGRDQVVEGGGMGLMLRSRRVE